jgi:hypothetical protein
MAYDTITTAGESDLDSSGYSLSGSNPSYGPLLPWAAGSYSRPFTADAILLRGAIASYSNPTESTVAEQVFGQQARQQGISLRHQANILYERALIHRARLREIDRRLMEFQSKLSIVKMHFPLDGGRTQQSLEKLIVDLEKQRHDEELKFWKDSADVRQKLFDGATVYSATRHRRDLLCGVEGDDDR